MPDGARRAPSERPIHFGPAQSWRRGIGDRAIGDTSSLACFGAAGDRTGVRGALRAVMGPSDSIERFVGTFRPAAAFGQVLCYASPLRCGCLPPKGLA